MSATLKTAQTVETRAARLAASEERMHKRVMAADTAIVAAERALARAQERLERARAKAEAVRQERNRLLAKQADQLAVAEERHTAAVLREETRASKPVRVVAPVGTVKTEDGRTLTLSKGQVGAIRSAVGRKRKGIVADAEDLLDTIDNGDSVGDTFTVTLKGRKTVIVFTIADEELMFATVNLAVAIAA